MLAGIVGLLVIVGACGGNPDDNVPAGPACDRTGPYDGTPGCVPGGELATVSRVLDAGTVVLTDGRRVRLAGVAVPAAGSCAAPAALSYTSAAVLGQTVRIVLDAPGAVDPSGSSWAYLRYGTGYLTDLGYDLATHGWATTFGRSPAGSAYLDVVGAAVKVARTGLTGQFGPPCGTSPTPPPAPRPPSPPKPASPPKVDVPDSVSEPDRGDVPEQADEPDPPSRPHTGNTGHPCLPGERDGDHDGYCGEGR